MAYIGKIQLAILFHMDNYLKEVIEQVEEETGYNVLTTGMEVYTNVNTEAQKNCGYLQHGRICCLSR